MKILNKGVFLLSLVSSGLLLITTVYFKKLRTYPILDDCIKYKCVWLDNSNCSSRMDDLTVCIDYQIIQFSLINQIFYILGTIWLSASVRAFNIILLHEIHWYAFLICFMLYAFMLYFYFYTYYRINF